MTDLASYRQRADRALADYDHARRTVRAERQEQGKAEDDHQAALEARKVVQEVAAGVQARVHAQVGRVVSKCLETIFDNPYTFEIRFEQKRGKTEAALLLTRDGKEFDPTAETGGGVVDVVAFALRLAALMLSQPARRRLLVLDEPFKHLSRDYGGRVRELVLTLAKEMKVQFVIVTHSPALVVGKVVRLTDG